MFSSQVFSAEFSTDDQGEFYTIFNVGNLVKKRMYLLSGLKTYMTDTMDSFIFV